MDPNQPMPTHYEAGMPTGQGPSQSPYQAFKTTMNVNLGVFREPRGVMRILQFVFSICAFATTTGYTNSVTLNLVGSCTQPSVKFDYSYPFRLDRIHQTVNCNITGQPADYPLHLLGDFSSDAQFFVTTGVLSFLYCIGIVIVYVMLDPMYQANGNLPLADFVLTVTVAVFWISGGAAWANGLSGLKSVTGALLDTSMCTDVCNGYSTNGYTGLNISVILGFLNFFLWASDLWFLYKETPWFKLKQGSAGVDTAA